MFPTTVEDNPSTARRRPAAVGRSGPPAIAGAPPTAGGGLFHDRSGTILAQTMVLLPVLVLVVFGGFEILRAMSVKQALHDGTYQAARYLALNPINDRTPSAWEDVAEMFIMQSLSAEVGEIRARQGLVDVTVEPPGTIPACGDITIEVTFHWTVDVPYFHLGVIPIRERFRTNTILC